jgi:filamentous hemagglutinin
VELQEVCDDSCCKHAADLFVAPKIGTTGPPASTPVGRSGNPLGGVQPNAPTTIAGRPYSGHAIDQMQARGIPPSVVENTIQHGRPFPGNTPGTTGYYDPTNNVSVITNTTTRNVITVRPGPP